MVILLDSITRLARAYNTVIPGSGIMLTGGVDAHALEKSKRFFFFFRCYGDRRALPSFPTRRSSDLQRESVKNDKPTISMSLSHCIHQTLNSKASTRFHSGGLHQLEHSSLIPFFLG